MIEVIRTGTEMSVQDLGRHNMRKYGIPQSGVMDTASAVRANTLVGNRADAALLECYLPGQKLKAHCQTRTAVAGASGILELNNKRIDGDSTFVMNTGDVLAIKKLVNGARTYIAFQNGLNRSKVLGSCSELSGFLSSRLKKSDRIALYDRTPGTSTNAVVAAQKIDPSKPIAVYPGPEFELLSKNNLNVLLETPFRILPESNRMGYRLDGPSIFRKRGSSLISSGVLPGTVQWLPDGRLVVLMRNCQTIGGYPRILLVNEPDINQLSQRKPGDDVLFELIE